MQMRVLADIEKGDVRILTILSEDGNPDVPLIVDLAEGDPVKQVVLDGKPAAALLWLLGLWIRDALCLSPDDVEPLSDENLRPLGSPDEVVYHLRDYGSMRPSIARSLISRCGEIGAGYHISFASLICTVHCPALAALTSQLRGQGMAHMRMPAFLDNLAPRQLRLFLSPMIYDFRRAGSPGLFLCASPGMRDDLQVLALRAGWSTTFDHSEPLDQHAAVTSLSRYFLEVYNDRADHHDHGDVDVTLIKMTASPFSATVYRPVMPGDHDARLLLIRRNGRCLFV